MTNLDKHYPMYATCSNCAYRAYFKNGADFEDEIAVCERELTNKKIVKEDDCCPSWKWEYWWIETEVEDVDSEA